MLSDIINYFKIQRVLRKIYASEKIPENLSHLFGVDCKVDWVGRLYMVVNPLIQNVNTGGNSIIMDHNDKMMIEEWVMKNLELIKNFVVNNQLFDLLTYSITKIDDDENYLVVFKNVYFDDMKRLVKIIGISSLALIIGIILLILL